MFHEANRSHILYKGGEEYGYFYRLRSAIVTPMKDNYEVNYDKLEELIDFHVKGGTDCIVIAGTTGEGATLSMEEHRNVIRAAVEFTRHRIPVVAGNRF